MESLSTFSGTLGNFDLNLEKTETHLRIEAENMISSKLYILKVTNDLLPDTAKTLFDDVDGLAQALVAGLQKANPNLHLSMGDDAKVKVEYKTIIINKERNFVFDLSLE